MEPEVSEQKRYRTEANEQNSTSFSLDLRCCPHAVLPSSFPPSATRTATWNAWRRVVLSKTVKFSHLFCLLQLGIRAAALQRGSQQQRARAIHRAAWFSATGAATGI
eukprot:1505823-Amphidinium_carterae.1